MKTIFLTAAILILLSCSIEVIGQYTQAQLQRIEEKKLENQKAEILSSLKGESISIPRFPRFPEPPPKLTNAEKLKLLPSEQDKERFASFLKQPKTGLIRLLPGDGCGSVPRILNVAEPCYSNTIAKIPGGGAYYSFRVKTNQAGSWSDIRFADGSFSAGARYLQALLVSLGDVDLNNVTIDVPAVRFLSNFTPATEVKEIENQTKLISHGISIDGFTYRYTQPVFENTTYVLRSIAYRRNSHSPTFDKFPPFDKRIDIIVAFRVVRKDNDGSVVLLWKSLMERKAPKLKFT